MPKSANSTMNQSTLCQERYRALHLPDWSKGNPYQNLLIKSLQLRGGGVELSDFPDGSFPLNRAMNRSGKLHVLHLHWINELIAPLFWGKGRIKLFGKLVLLVVDVLVVRLRGVKVVWTIHNLVAHESPNPAIELLARRLLARACSDVILHSEGARLRVEKTYGVDLSEKSTIIAHGNYDGCYPLAEEKRDEFIKLYNPDGKNIVILYFGAIRPYKGVSTLIETFRRTPSPNLRLIVAGRPHTEKIRDEVIALAEPDHRISLLLDFIPEEHVAALFKTAAIVAIPFENTLTSGSVALTLTMGKPLILPEDARVLGLVSDACSLFYDNEDSLKKTIENLDRISLEKMEKIATAISSSNPWDKVAKLTEMTYLSTKKN